MASSSSICTTVMALSSIMVSSTFLLIFTILVAVGEATNFHIVNNCPYTVWAAASPGGGQQLDHGYSWDVDISIPQGPPGRVWGRTGCNFTNGGVGSCQTGDCGGVLTCNSSGSPPATLAEFSRNQVGNLDFYDISIVDGFNVPIGFRPTFWKCEDIFCSADINRQCPPELKTAGACHHPCNVFNTAEDCCASGSSSCVPTNYTQFFKSRCPTSYITPYDGATFSCPTGTDYTVTFCP